MGSVASSMLEVTKIITMKKRIEIICHHPSNIKTDNCYSSLDLYFRAAYEIKN